MLWVLLFEMCGDFYWNSVKISNIGNTSKFYRLAFLVYLSLKLVGLGNSRCYLLGPYLHIILEFIHNFVSHSFS